MRLAAKATAGPTLAGLLGITGALHFVVPRFYDAIIPPVLPGSARTWVLASGGAELVCAAAVASPRTRRLGAGLAAILFVLVFPANVQMALNWRRGSTLRALVGAARLPLQVPLVWWAWRVHRSAGPVS